MKNIFFISFIVVALAQWYVPVNMLREREAVLNKGKAFKFLTEPIDPVDPLKGRYVQLNFKAHEIKVNNAQFSWYDEAYVTIATGADGYAMVTAISKHKPEGNNDYVKVNVSEVSYKGTVFIYFPFDKFYMDEIKAPKAEILYRATSPLSSRTAYALVHVYRGEAVLKNLYIDDKPIETYLR